MSVLLLVLIVAGILLLAALGVGVVVLIKMGVIFQYATREEPPDLADYELNESHEVDEK
jgi:hypothetical protein